MKIQMIFFLIWSRFNITCNLKNIIETRYERYYVQYFLVTI